MEKKIKRLIYFSIFGYYNTARSSYSIDDIAFLPYHCCRDHHQWNCMVVLHLTIIVKNPLRRTTAAVDTTIFWRGCVCAFDNALK